MTRKMAALIRFMECGLFVSLLLTLSACGGPPTWVKKGSGPMNSNDERVFYGVGSVEGIQHADSLAWEAAENRARAEMVRNLQAYTAYLMRDYAAATTAGDFSKTAEEQNIERAVKTFAAATLTGVRKVDQYKDKETGTYYVLVKMDLERAKEMLGQSKELNKQVREYVRQNAERLFDKLEKEEAKQAQK
ncbi:MAG: LPP20 family lipoprotein [Nitrospirota bacterium]